MVWFPCGMTNLSAAWKAMPLSAAPWPPGTKGMLVRDNPPVRAVVLGHGHILVGTKGGDVLEISKEGVMNILTQVTAFTSFWESEVLRCYSWSRLPDAPKLTLKISSLCCLLSTGSWGGWTVGSSYSPQQALLCHGEWRQEPESLGPDWSTQDDQL